MQGLNNGAENGVYGTLGTPQAANIPAARYLPSTWSDTSGNLWLFGGNGGGAYGLNFNDLWKLNPSTNEWAWMGGCALNQFVIPTCARQAQPDGIIGTLGVTAAANIPPSRSGATSWTDNSGNFWLFGGSGLDSSGTPGMLNDLWEYAPSKNEWAWMGGSVSLGNN
jgi:N-acetylneuraminic acid mutarotase